MLAIALQSYTLGCDSLLLMSKYLATVHHRDILAYGGSKMAHGIYEYCQPLRLLLEAGFLIVYYSAYSLDGTNTFSHTQTDQSAPCNLLGTFRDVDSVMMVRFPGAGQNVSVVWFYYYYTTQVLA